MNPSMNYRAVLVSKNNLQLYQDVKAAVLHPCTSSITVCSSEFGFVQVVKLLHPVHLICPGLPKQQQFS